MRNPYKKFQNSSIHGSKVMLCIKKRDERTDGRKDGRTTQKQLAPQLLWSWGHNQSSGFWQEDIFKFSIQIYRENMPRPLAAMFFDESKWLEQSW